MNSDIQKPSPEQISSLAYKLHAQKGYPQGQAMEDWLEAERQLLGKSTGSPATHNPQGKAQEGSRPQTATQQNPQSAQNSPAQPSGSQQNPQNGQNKNGQGPQGRPAASPESAPGGKSGMTVTPTPKSGSQAKQENFGRGTKPVAAGRSQGGE